MWYRSIIAFSIIGMVVLMALPVYAANKFDMLSYIVRLHVGQATGSGIVISSHKGDTYAVTACHVLEDNIVEMDAPDNKGKVHVFKTLTADFFRYENHRMVETMTRDARIIACDKDLDIGVIKIVMHTEPLPDGDILSAQMGMLPDVFDEVYSVGAGLALVPFPTSGIVSSLDGISIAPVKTDPLFIMHTATITHGFSGGGLFKYNSFSDKYELIGINVQIGIASMGYSELNFMSYAIPMSYVRTFLERYHLPY